MMKQCQVEKEKETVCLKLNPPLGMAGEPVTQDGNSVHRTTAVEMDLQLICSSSIVHLGYVQQCVRSEV